MNFRSFSYVRSVRSVLAFVAAAFVFAFASTANAQTTTSCNSCTIPVPALSALNAIGLATANGTGAIVGNGNTFVGNVIKDGGAAMNINLSHVGNGCPGGCGATQVDIRGSAYEAVRAYGASSSNTPGKQADMANAVVSRAMVGFEINTTPITGD